MRKILTAILIFSFSAVCYGAGKIKTSPLGFLTADFSAELWASLGDHLKLKGSVSGVLTYEDVTKVFVIRTHMHVLAGDYLERFIQASIPAERQLSIGSVPERISRDLRRPLLTAVFETRKGDLGLITIYPGMTIIELNGRYGMIFQQTALGAVGKE